MSSKTFTLILFVIAPVLVVDGIFGVDRTWRRIHLGAAARLLVVGKLCAALVASSLVMIGVAL